VAEEPVSLGPWPFGIDNVSDTKSRVFQIPGKGDPLPRLREAENVDLDREGGAQRRPGWTRFQTLTDGHSGASVGGMPLFVDDGSLKRADRLTTLAAGLTTHQVSYTEHEGRIYWTNGTQTGQIENGVAGYWGMLTADPPRLSETSGGLRAGTYLVALTGVRADGAESGVRLASSITLASAGGILITPQGVDHDAVTLRVYCTDADGADLFWVQDAPVGPVVISQVEQSTAICRALGCYPPPPGELVSAHNGRVLIASGPDLYFSMALAPHLFRADIDWQRFPGNIQMIAPQIDGFYVATDEPRVYWISGSEPANWRRQVVGDQECAFGDSKRVEGHKHPWLEYPGFAAVWVTEHGLAYGLPSGQIRYPTSGRTAMDPHQGASYAFREQAGLRQLLVGMRSRISENQLGIADQFVAERIPASGS
jgi:hypothetical protein